MLKKSVALIFGGASSEYDVSCMSVASVAENIDRDLFEVYMLGVTRNGDWYLYTGDIDTIRNAKWEEDEHHLIRAFISPERTVHGIQVMGSTPTALRLDAVFPVMHGRNCEDGTIQGLFELAGIPYVGCGVLSSAQCMDKDICHLFLGSEGIRQVKWCTFQKGCSFDEALCEAETHLHYPFFVKPANAGSSVGVTKVACPSEFHDALALAFNYDKKVVVEEGVKSPIEVECAVLGNSECIVGGPGEIVAADEFYTYEAKYYNDKSEVLLKARISPEKAEEVRATAIKAYKALGCRGLTRMDFLIDGENGDVYLNEPNTLPGFTSISMYPKLIMDYGISYKELITTLFKLAMEEN